MNYLLSCIAAASVGVYLLTLSAEGKQHSNGRYHTIFYAEKDLANYENDVYLYSELPGDAILIESLARKVATDLNNTDRNHVSRRIGSIVPYCFIDEMEKKTYSFIPDSIKPTGIFQPPQGTS